MNLHVAKYGLLVTGLFVGMCGAGYLAAAIVVDKIINVRR